MPRPVEKCELALYQYNKLRFSFVDLTAGEQRILSCLQKTTACSKKCGIAKSMEWWARRGAYALIFNFMKRAQVLSEEQKKYKMLARKQLAKLEIEKLNKDFRSTKL
jgi:hypothetical protein